MTMSKQGTVLVVDDEPRLVEMTRMILENRDYKVLEASNGQEAIAMAKAMEPDLVLLDVMMPVMDGFTACQRIRDFSDVPIIMVTAKGEDYDQVNGLEKGADDYVIKPFTPMVLAARVQAAIRRHSKGPSGSNQNEEEEGAIKLGNLVIDPRGRDLLIAGQKVELNRKEFDLLYYLCLNQGISLSRDQILEKVWGYDYLGSESTVDTHVNRLRKKLGSCEQYLQTVRGYGYRLEVVYEE